MNSTRSPHRRYGVLTFFSLTYAATWIWFIVAAALSSLASGVPGLWAIRQLFFLPGVFAPALVPVGLTARAEGRTGMRPLLERVLQWRVGAQWYFFAVGFIPAVKLAVALVYRVATGAWPHFGNLGWYVIPLAILISTPFQAGEEIGWRG